MAVTRFYLTSDAAPASPAFDAGWEQTAGAARGALSRTKAGTNTAVTVAETVSTNPFDVALGQWVSPPMTRAGTLTGNYSVAAARMESDAAANFVTEVFLRVVAEDGTVRGSVETTGAVEWATSHTAGTFSAISLGSIACEVGDRLVFEYGYRATNTVTTSYSGTMRYGGTDVTDLESGDTGDAATSRPPWIEFDDASATDLFAGAPFMTGTLGEDARLAVEMAWGADLAGSEDDWQWHDITGDVRYDDGIDITRGSSDEASQTQPAECLVTLDNSAAGYSLSPLGPNYPNVRRNTPFRVRIDPDGSGYRVRFQGGATEFKPEWDKTGRDAIVRFAAHGTLRRLAQGSAPVSSAYKRAMLNKTDVVAYWPCEEESGARVISSAFDGYPGMAIDGTKDDPLPDFATDDTFLCSKSLPAMKTTIWRGPVPAYSFTGSQQVRWLMKTPDTGIVTTFVRIYMTGTIPRWDFNGDISGNLQVIGYNTSGAVAETSGLFSFRTNDTVRQYHIGFTQNGGNIDYTLGVLTVGLGSASASDSVAGTLGSITSVVVNPTGNMDTHIVGHVSVQNVVTSFSVDTAPVNANANESVTTRVTRLCSENAVPLTLAGTTGKPSGAQPQGTLIDLLRDCELTDSGILSDGRSAGLYYRGRRDFHGTLPTMTFDVSAGDLADEFQPADDDRLNVNKATATKYAGSSATYVNTDGPAGTAATDVYDTSVKVNPHANADLISHASWIVHCGTITGYRFPRVHFAIHRTPDLLGDWLAADLGDRIDVIYINTVRTQLPEAVELGLVGYRERIDQFTWSIEMNCVPWQTFKAGRFTSGQALRLASDGSTLAASASAGATSLSVATASGPIWTTDAADFPMTIEVEGIPIEVTAISGASSPQTFTVTGSDVTKALSTGSAVTIYQPYVLGL